MNPEGQYHTVPNSVVRADRKLTYDHYLHNQPCLKVSHLNVRRLQFAAKLTPERKRILHQNRNAEINSPSWYIRPLFKYSMTDKMNLLCEICIYVICESMLVKYCFITKCAMLFKCVYSLQIYIAVYPMCH